MIGSTLNIRTPATGSAIAEAEAANNPETAEPVEEVNEVVEETTEEIVTDEIVTE